MSNTVSISADGRGISREWDERLAEAQAVIGQYCQDGDDGRLHFEHALESLVSAKLNAKGGEVEEWTDQVQSVLKARATDDDTIYPFVQKATKNDSDKMWTVPQGVPLDIGEDSVEEAEGRNWGLPVPYIHFCKIKPGDSFFSEGTDTEDGTIGASRWMAVAFDPDEANDPDLVRSVMWNEQPVTIKSDWDATGYVGVVRTFGSYTEMKSARRALIEALRSIHTDLTDSDGEPDPYADNEYLDEVNYSDDSL